jgi:hypothetical protein
MFVVFGIRHVGWSKYQGYLTAFCFHEKLPFSGYHKSCLGCGLYPLFLWSQWWLNTMNIGISLH